jgi:ribose transport system substrate-binding protein
MNKTSIIVMAAALGLTALVGCSKKESQQATAPGDHKYNIELITMDSMDEHWLSVKKGAEKRVEELGNVNLSFSAPAAKADPSEQVRLTEDAINKKVDAILLAPSDKTALVPAIEKAEKAGIKIVLIDSNADTDSYEELLSTDNKKAGQMAADRMAELIGSKGTVAIVGAQPGSATTMLRENSFVDEVKQKYPNIKLVPTQYSDGDKIKALNITLDFITAHPDLAGIYGCNEGSTVGIARGVEQSKKINTIKVVGFDKSQDIIAAVESGIVQASMVQNPYQMGYQGIDAAVKVLTGQKVEKQIDTGVNIMTKDNVSQYK